jgi:threonine/homoserine/homoserine lactone efflux protein
LDPQLIAYLTTTFLLAVTPGATTAVVVRNTLAHGGRGGLAAALGSATGNTIQAIVAGLGVAVLFSRWPAAESMLRIGGGVFLIWLGVGSIRRAWRDSARLDYPDSNNSGNGENSAGQNLAAYRQGLTVNLLNPAITSFYLVVLPSFMPDNAPVWYYAALAAAHVVIAFACHTVWMLAFDRLRRGDERPSLTRALEVVTGVVLIALAINVMASG